MRLRVSTQMKIDDDGAREAAPVERPMPVVSRPIRCETCGLSITDAGAATDRRVDDRRKPPSDKPPKP